MELQETLIRQFLGQPGQFLHPYSMLCMLCTTITMIWKSLEIEPCNILSTWPLKFWWLQPCMIWFGHSNSGFQLVWPLASLFHMRWPSVVISSWLIWFNTINYNTHTYSYINYILELQQIFDLFGYLLRLWHSCRHQKSVPLTIKRESWVEVKFGELTLWAFGERKFGELIHQSKGY